jgi:hypothetical protein
MKYNTFIIRSQKKGFLLTFEPTRVMNSFTVEMANELVNAETASEDDNVGNYQVVAGPEKAFCYEYWTYRWREMCLDQRSLGLWKIWGNKLVTSNSKKG